MIVVGGGWPGASIARVALRGPRTSNGTAWSSICWRPAGAADSVCCACRSADMSCSPAATWTSPPSANCWHDCRRRRWRATSRSWDGRRAAAGSSPEWIEASVAGRDGSLAIATGGIAGSDSRARALLRWRDCRSAGARYAARRGRRVRLRDERCHEHHHGAFRALAVCLAARRVTLSGGAPV